MTTLVQRLRNGPAPLGDPDLNDAAADEINALRELLRECRAALLWTDAAAPEFMSRISAAVDDKEGT